MPAAACGAHAVWRVRTRRLPARRSAGGRTGGRTVRRAVVYAEREARAHLRRQRGLRPDRRAARARFRLSLSFSSSALRYAPYRFRDLDDKPPVLVHTRA